MARSLVPDALATLPWQVILPLTFLTCFGAAVLYSAAGGHMQPYATSHLVRFVLFLAMALVIARLPRELVRWAAYPAYAGIMLLLLGVEALGRDRRRQPALARARAAGAPAFGADEADHRAGAGELLSLAAFGRDRRLALNHSGRGADRVAGGADHRAARPRHRDGDRFRRGVHGVSRRPAHALVCRRRRGGRGRRSAGLFLRAARLPAQPRDHLPRSRERPARHRLHITQSKIAIGSGGIFGKGFGNGSQSHLNYLPEPHTDFVFATMSEEWGLVGGLAVLLVFGIVLRWGMGVARRAPDRFSQLLAGGDDGNDLLLCDDQFDDGHRHGPCGRHSTALHEPWRIVDDDEHDLHRHDHDGRPLD